MVNFRIRRDAGVMAEIRNVVRKKTEVEVLPVVDLSAESFFFLFFVGDATQVELVKQSTCTTVIVLGIERVFAGCITPRTHADHAYREWGMYSCHAGPSSYDHRPLHPYNAETEQLVGFSPTRQALLVPSAKRNVRCSASRMKHELHATNNRL